jgi:hypothetical protein
MGAYVNAEFGTHPVTNVRFKKAGEWRNVTSAYIKVGSNLRKWWPSIDDVEGKTSSPPITLAQAKPFTLAWNPSGNDFMIVSIVTVNDAQTMQYFDYPTKSVLNEEKWNDRRVVIGGNVNQGTDWEPKIVDAYAFSDGSGFVLLDERGIRIYKLNQFGTLTQTWRYVTAADGSNPVTVTTVPKPLMTVGTDPVPSGYTFPNGTFMADLGGIGVRNTGYVNSPIGSGAYFGRCESIVVDPDESFAYVLDSRNYAIRKVSLTAPYGVTTLAGLPPTGTFGNDYSSPAEPTSDVDGVGTSARFRIRNRSSLAMHPSGDYILLYQDVSSSDFKMRKIWLKDVGVKVAGQVETWATRGNLTVGGEMLPNRLVRCRDIAFDPSGRWLYILRERSVIKIDVETTNGVSSLVAGSITNTSGFVDSDDPSSVRFANLQTISVNSATGWIMVTEHNPDRVRFIF